MDRASNDTPPLVVETGAAPVASVIWLHGLGADGHDFEPIVPELRLPATLPVRFVFPHAPYRAVTWNNGYVMRAWYDIAMTERGFHQNLDHLREAEALVHALIAEERSRGLDSSRIVVAGFSQGGAVAIHAALHYPDSLGGLLCLSAPVPSLDQLVGGGGRAKTALPVFVAHGTQDAVVPYALGLRTRDALTAAGMTLQWHSYEMGHGVCAEEIADISRWLCGVLHRDG